MAGFDPFIVYLLRLAEDIGQDELNRMKDALKGLENRKISVRDIEKIEHNPYKLLEVLRNYGSLTKKKNDVLIKLFEIAGCYNLSRNVKVRFEKGFDRDFDYGEVVKEAETRFIDSDEQINGNIGVQRASGDIQQPVVSVAPVQQMPGISVAQDQQMPGISVAPTQQMPGISVAPTQQMLTVSSTQAQQMAASEAPQPSSRSSYSNDQELRDTSQDYQLQVSTVSCHGKTVLFISSKWSNEVNRLAVVNKNLAELLTKKGATSYTTSLRASQQDFTRDSGVTVVHPQESVAASFEPSIKWLSALHRSLFPQLETDLKGKVDVVVGYLVTGQEKELTAACIKIKKDIAPTAKLILFNLEVPQDIGVSVDYAEEADAVFSLGRYVYDHFDVKYNALKKRPKHYCYMPPVMDMFTDINVQPLADGNVQQILTLCEVESEADFDRFQVIAKAIGRVATNYGLMNEHYVPYWSLYGVKDSVRESFAHYLKKEAHSKCLEINVNSAPVLMENIESYLLQSVLLVAPEKQDPFNFPAYFAMQVGFPALVPNCSGIADFLTKIFPDTDHHFNSCVNVGLHSANIEEDVEMWVRRITQKITHEKERKTAFKVSHRLKEDLINELKNSQDDFLSEILSTTDTAGEPAEPDSSNQSQNRQRNAKRGHAEPETQPAKRVRTDRHSNEGHFSTDTAGQPAEIDSSNQSQNRQRNAKRGHAEQETQPAKRVRTDRHSNEGHFSTDTAGQPAEIDSSNQSQNRQRNAKRGHAEQETQPAKRVRTDRHSNEGHTSFENRGGDAPGVETNQSQVISKSTEWATKMEELKGETQKKMFKELGPYKVGKSTDFKIADGNDGTRIFLGCCASKDLEVAVKRMHKPDNIEHKDLEHKMSDYKKVQSSPNIVTYYDFLHDENDDEYVYLVMELCERTLAEHIEKPKNNSLSWEERKRLVVDMFLGLKALHDERIVHRDLKPQNILIGCDGKAKLSDFGLSRQLDRTNTRLTRQTAFGAGTECWQARETLFSNENQEVDCHLQSDIQVCGMLVHYILTVGKHPFGKLSPQAESIVTQQNVKDGKYKMQLNCLVAKHLVEWMLMKDRRQRPSIGQIFIHPFMWETCKQLEFLQKVAAAITEQTEINPDNEILKQILREAETCSIRRPDLVTVLRKDDVLSQWPQLLPLLYQVFLQNQKTPGGREQKDPELNWTLKESLKPFFME